MREIWCRLCRDGVQTLKVFIRRVTSLGRNGFPFRPPFFFLIDLLLKNVWRAVLFVFFFDIDDDDEGHFVCLLINLDDDDTC